MMEDSYELLATLLPKILETLDNIQFTLEGMEQTLGEIHELYAYDPPYLDD